MREEEGRGGEGSSESEEFETGVNKLWGVSFHQKWPRRMEVHVSLPLIQVLRNTTACSPIQVSRRFSSLRGSDYPLILHPPFDLPEQGKRAVVFPWSRSHIGPRPP